LRHQSKAFVWVIYAASNLDQLLGVHPKNIQ
jgi:hypothetical protein